MVQYHIHTILTHLVALIFNPFWPALVSTLTFHLFFISVFLISHVPCLPYYPVQCFAWFYKWFFIAVIYLLIIVNYLVNFYYFLRATVFWLLCSFLARFIVMNFPLLNISSIYCIITFLKVFIFKWKPLSPLTINLCYWPLYLSRTYGNKLQVFK